MNDYLSPSGKILRKHNTGAQNKALQGGIFSQINKIADQNKAIHMGWNRRAGGYFSHNQ